MKGKKKFPQKGKPNQRRRGPNSNGIHQKSINKKNKLQIQFNADDRKGYLKGFKKRKDERRKVAQEKLDKDLKEELKQIRNERREMLKKMVTQDIPDFSIIEDDEDSTDKVVTTCGSATVEISELDLSKSNQNPIKDKDNSEEEDDDRIPLYTKDKLEEMGIFDKKGLKKSLKQSATRAMKASRLMQIKQDKHSREQRKKQRIRKTKRNKVKLKKMKRRMVGRPNPNI